MGYRARSLASHLQKRYDVHIAYRSGSRIRALLRFLRFLLKVKPRISYVFDMSYSGVFGAWLYKLLFRNRLIVDTGDVIYELVRSTGNRGSWGLRLTRWFEQFSLRVADGVVVRGSLHQQWLAGRGVAAEIIEVIQDGVDTQQFIPLKVEELRKQYGLDGVLTIGLVGSSVWSKKLGMCYGWELVEALRLLKHAPVKGIIIGHGSGIPRLKALCQEYGIEDKVLFLGYVPYEQLPQYLNLIDVCLSTQTNNLVGQVRTTGKLPLYLAAGRYILASEVGEAARVLDQEMLVQYEGVKDEQYPQKLVGRIKTILDHPQMLERSARNVALAKEYFDYAVLAERMGNFIERTLTRVIKEQSYEHGHTTSD